MSAAVLRMWFMILGSAVAVQGTVSPSGHYPAVPGVVLTFATTNSIPVGLELLPFDAPDPSPRPNPSSLLIASRTVREAFDAILSTDDRYRQSQFDGIINIGPVEGSGDILGQRVERFSLHDATALETLIAVHRIFDCEFSLGTARSPQVPTGFSADRRERLQTAYDLKLSLSLSDVTVRNVLNEVIRLRGDALWKIEYASRPARYKNATLSLVGFSGWEIAVTSKRDRSISNPCVQR